MKNTHEPGLGELLRHLTDLVDGGASDAYTRNGLTYKPRYSPIMRCLGRGMATISEITDAVNVTQGAVSQTIKLMEADGLVKRDQAADSRSFNLALTPSGRDLLVHLERHWQATFRAIRTLEQEIEHPIRDVLKASIAALNAKDFSDRITDEFEGQADG